MYSVKTYKIENRSGNAEGFFVLLLARIFFLSFLFYGLVAFYDTKRQRDATKK